MTSAERELPSALAAFGEMQARLSAHPPALFIDYDGTLSPIAPRPELAQLTPKKRTLLAALAELCPVAIITGRDLDNIRNLVRLPELYYAGSHGFDIAGPGVRHQPDPALPPVFVALAAELRPVVDQTPGAVMELKAASVSVHYRLVTPESVPPLEAAVDRAVANHGETRKALGKKVFEIRPTLDWHKGSAVRWLLEHFDETLGKHTPVFLGDDRTDEDALREIANEGIGILVGEGGDWTTEAQFHLHDPDEVEQFLRHLHAWLREQH